MANDTIGVMQKLYNMANNHFRHGMTTPFSLKSGASVTGMLLFIRLGAPRAPARNP